MNISDYIEQFSSLNTARIAGKNAPHKAVLLLAIMDLVEDGVIDSPRIELTKQLESSFELVWKRYVGVSLIFTPKVTMPYWHLVSEPFYSLHIISGQEIKGGSGRYSIKWLRNNIYAMVDEDLLALMQDNKSRNKLRETLINTYLNQFNHKEVKGAALSSAIIAFLGLFLQTAA